MEKKPKVADPYGSMKKSGNEIGKQEGLEVIYRDPAVRARISDYLGMDENQEPTAYCVARCDGRLPTEIERIPIHAWENALTTPGDLARSLSDRKSLIVHLDVEYVNFNSPEESYVDPWRAFRLQEPVVTVIEEELSRVGIRPLHLLTGQGHHFVWQVPLDSDSCRRLATEIHLRSNGRSASQSLARGVVEDAFGGLGLVMEFLAHRIKQLAAPLAEIPVDLTAVEVGTLSSGRREMISIDISEYGDPLEERIIRIPFTHYEKPWRNGMVERLSLQSSVPKFVTLPLHEIDVSQALVLRQTSEEVIALARRSIVRIPNQEGGMSRLIDAYLSSGLRPFHQQYYEEDVDAKNEWPRTYGKAPLETFPPCVATILTFPNDLLLKPAGLQLVTRYLIANGWHPRHIAGLVQSKFADPHFNWLPSYWEKYSPEMRSDFYVRLFSGQVGVQVDEGLDFNCVSTQEKGYCPGIPCRNNLSDHQVTLNKNQS